MKPGQFILFSLSACIFIINCCKPIPENKPQLKVPDKTNDLGRISALPLICKDPAYNPTSIEKIELGRLLFYDPILSGKKDIACATCHHPEFMYAENPEISVGVNGKGIGENRKFNAPNDIPFTKRNSQSLLNVGFNGIDPEGKYSPEKAPMFWDLRAEGLESQAFFPLKSFEEMRGHAYDESQTAKVIEKRITAIPAYRKLFNKAFPDSSQINIKLITQALATFQRSLTACNSRFDQYMRGNKSKLSGREIEGMNLFIQTGCARCHSGPMLSDFKVHVMGIPDNEKLTVSDSGYQQTYAFRTPSLRNLRFTRPYMHSGKFKTLDEVLTFYEDLHGKELPNKNVSRAKLDPLASKLKVEYKNITPIIEFLNTLNDEEFDKTIPAAVPSGLPVGGKLKY